jgi:hypothetical protein
MSENININEIDCTPLSGKDAGFRDGQLQVGLAEVFKKGTILAINASGVYIPFVKGGAAPADVPVAILTSDVDATAGAGTFPIRPQIKGECRLAKLIIHADGDNSNVDSAVINQLQDYNVTVVDAQQLGGYDNNNG